MMFMELFKHNWIDWLIDANDDRVEIVMRVQLNWITTVAFSIVHVPTQLENVIKTGLENRSVHELFKMNKEFNIYVNKSKTTISCGIIRRAYFRTELDSISNA